LLLDKEGWVCECNFEDKIDKDRSVIYRHFRNLEAAGLLATNREGRLVKVKVKNRKKIERLLELAQEVSQDEN